MSRQNFPIENIAGVSTGTRFDIIGLIIGLIGVLFGLAALAIPIAALLGIIVILVGGAAVVGSPKQAIEVMNSGGGRILFPVSVLERSQTMEFANRVAEAVARVTVRPTGDRSSYAPSSPDLDPADAMRQLQRLRDQGLITGPEYAAKRSEILARL